MSNERCDFAIGAGDADAFVDAACEMCNTVFEVMVSDLHDIYKRHQFQYAGQTCNSNGTHRIHVE